MTNELPTVSIKGNPYVLVKDRIAHFNAEYSNGSIITDLVSNRDGQVVMKAVVRPDSDNPGRFFTGFSQAKENDGMVNKTAALENAESSAVGRALAMMGIGVIESIASADEVAKAVSPNATVPHPYLQKAQAMRETRQEGEVACETCGQPATIKTGVSAKTGKPWRGAFCTVDRGHVKWMKAEDEGKPEPAPAKEEEAEGVPPDDAPF